MFRYEPETKTEESKENKVPKYFFLNSSGNAIHKDSNLKLVEKNKNKSIEDEYRVLTIMIGLL